MITLYRNGLKYVLTGTRGVRVVLPQFRIWDRDRHGAIRFTATLWEDGTASCTCRRWHDRGGHDRACAHARDVLDLRGESHVGRSGPRPAADPGGPAPPRPDARAASLANPSPRPGPARATREPAHAETTPCPMQPA